jgi:outer membrane receptor protein involved in Fe transport
MMGSKGIGARQRLLLGASSALLTVFATPAFAQDGAAAGSQAGVEVTEVVVTGSRITRRDFNAESPIVTVGREQINAVGGVTAEAVLNKLPQFTPSYGAATTFPNRGGQANLNLRGLGTNRALVLLDGRRIVPSHPDGSVDVNIIPNMLIGRVETITGGASATYGSDAMAGVVNFQLRTDMDGLEVDAQYGISDRGDAQTYDLGVAGGTNFAGGRGHGMFFLGYSEREGVLTGEREFPRNRLMLAYQPTGDVRSVSNQPSQAVVNSLFASYGYANPGSITVFGLNPDGTLYKQAPTTSPVINYRGELNDLFLNRGNQIALAASATYSLQIPLERFNAFGRVQYDVSDDLKVFAEGFYTEYDAVASQTFPLVGSVGQSVRVPVTNPFLSDDVRTLMASRPNPSAPFNLTTALTSLGAIEYDAHWEVYQLTAGIKGNLQFRDWTWDAYVSQGHVENIDRRANTASLSAIQAFLDAPGGGAASSDPVRCEGGFNPFGRQITADCAAKIKRDGFTYLTLEQLAAEVNFQGELFQVPAGSARFAAGMSARENSYDFAPDASMLAGDLVGQPATQASDGTVKVAEVYGELLLPVVRDLPLAERVELNLGARYSNYNTSGGVGTYKANLEWTVWEPLVLRGGYSRAVRAPSLSELYSATAPASSVIGVASATTTAGDPCDIRSSFRLGANANSVRDLCLAQGVPAGIIGSYTANQTTAFGTTSGNRDLNPEQADTYSIGAVLRSPFHHAALTRLQVSVDYFNIKIDDAISQLTLATSVPLCFNSTGSSNPTFDPNNVYCRYVQRDANGFINGEAPMLNLGSIATDGVDVQVDWNAAFEDLGLSQVPGELTLGVYVTYLNSLYIQVVEDAARLQYAGSTGGTTGNVSPKWRSTTNLSYRLGGVTLGGRWRHIGEAQDVSRVTSSTSTVPGVPEVDYFDLFGRWKINERLELRGGVNNLEDRELPQVGSVAGNSDFSTYDPIGRSYYIGLRARF